LQLYYLGISEVRLITCQKFPGQILSPTDHLQVYLHTINFWSLLSNFVWQLGDVCFICEDEGSPSGLIQDQHRCWSCPTVALSRRSPSELVSHMGMHILHDSAIRNSPAPCGFCLMPDGMCTVRLKKGRGRKSICHIDWEKTTCQRSNKVRLSIKTFQKCTKNSPCTNVPIDCPICPTGSNAVWKYNLRAHIETVHPTANIDEYKPLFEVSKDERILLKKRWTTKPRWTPRRFRDLGDISISESHRASLATR
jgi:hypothetical protein